MIQRIQSIFLLLVAIAMITHLFFPVWQKVEVIEKEVITINGFELLYESFDSETGETTLISSKYTLLISILASLAAGLSLYSIFQYKNRLTQIKLGALNSLLMGGSLFSALYYIWKADPMLPNSTDSSYLFGFYAIIMGLIFNSIANRFIRRDENLVRSADRLR